MHNSLNLFAKSLQIGNRCNLEIMFITRDHRDVHPCHHSRLCRTTHL